HHEYYFDLPVELRIELLRDAMKNQPVQSWDDLEARFHYKSYSWEQQWVDAQDFDDPEWSRLFADIQILRAGTEASAAEDVSSTDTAPMPTSAPPCCPGWTPTRNCPTGPLPAM